VRADRRSLFIGVAVAIVGLAAAVYYARLGLTLSHYDAKGHLVVARRVIDSLTPGWQQIGAVWLPLPHLLNLLPVQIDVFYRTGVSAVVLSIASSGMAAFALARIVTTGRPAGAIAGAVAAAAALALNPNTLYLQSTPMTEPLLIGLLLLATALVREWIDGRASTAAAGSALFLACWTRYEAWPVTGALLALAAVARMRRGESPRVGLRPIARLASYPICAGLLFLLLSRITVGEWFVSGGFFVPENPALGRPIVAAGQVLGGAWTIAGPALMIAGLAGAAVLAGVGLASPGRASLLVLLAPLAAAALPWYAFLQGHPYRVRYMVVHVATLALTSGAALSLLPRRAAYAAGALLVATTVWLRPPLDANAAMVREAQWDRRNAAARKAGVTAYLERNWDGGTLMASMGSLGHYMQELSHAGLGIRDFLHEGNGDLWKAALRHPAAHVKWVLIEERAEGGDMLAERARRDPAFLAGFTRVAAGGGVALYAAR